jgi:hypothetical protein
MARFGACFGEFVVVRFAAAKARVEGMKAAPRNAPLSGPRACFDDRCADFVDQTYACIHPALIDTCMSFRLDQLQEVRTAPAAHDMAHPQEGPVTPSSRRSWLAKQARGGCVALGRKGRQRPTSSILTAIAQRRAVWLMMVGAHCHGAASWQPLPVHGSIVDETRNAEDRREVPGGSGGSRRSRGWET